MRSDVYRKSVGAGNVKVPRNAAEVCAALRCGCEYYFSITNATEDTYNAQGWRQREFKDGGSVKGVGV